MPALRLQTQPPACSVGAPGSLVGSVVVGDAVPDSDWFGSVLLVMSAYVDRQWGFLMLEAASVVVTLRYRKLRPIRVGTVHKS